ncbi:MAG: NADH-quinone oxidoreductase subunit NuoE [Bacillota bacterium]
MAWPVEDRRSAVVKEGKAPLLTDAMKKELAEKYFPRYPTKRAVLLPALHMVQHAYNWIPMQAIQEVAEFLEIAPAEALDTASFYEEYWLKPKGKYLIQVCRSLTCEICGSRRLTERIKQKLHVEVGETTADGKFTLVELECLGSCGTAPVMLVNEVLFENLTPESLDPILDNLPHEPEQFKDPTITWQQEH